MLNFFDPSQSVSVIYDEDTREDVITSNSNRISRSTALLLKKDELTRAPWPLGKSLVLCEGERFLEQPTQGFCSGVLIGTRQILTAGHCVRNMRACSEMAVTFNWTADRAQNSLKSEDIFYCKNIVSREYDVTKGLWNWDYAVIELDRDVPSLTPVKIAPASTTLEADEPVFSYSYPLGLPLKQDIGEVIAENPKSNFWRVRVDTFQGSSGSPLYNKSGELVGILSQGAGDFDEEELHEARRTNSCAHFRRCPKGSDNQECAKGELFFKAFLIP